MAPKSKPLADRFWPKVEKSLGCWLWKAVRNNEGYGQILGEGGRKARFLLAHRISYEMAYGNIPQNLQVLHKCDNRACVNPSHLWLGTQKDNVHDAENKKRARHPAGEEHSQHKLTWPQIHEIRRLRIQSDLTLKQIAKQYSVSDNAIFLIEHGRRWSEGVIG